MKKTKYIICFIFLFLTGCALNPVITASNMKDGYDKKISGLSIVYLGNKLGSYESSIKPKDFNKLSIPFTHAGINTDLFFYSGLDLNAKEHLAEYAKKNNFILIVDPTTMTTGDSVTVNYNLSLYDVPLGEKIWVANLWVPFGWTRGVFERYDEMGNLIINKLIDSGLISKNK